MRELKYESPKRGAGAPLQSSWIAENDTKTRTHLEGKGWRVIETRGVARINEDDPTPLPEPKAEAEAVAEDDAIPEQGVTAVLLGVSDAQMQVLLAAGYDTVESLRAAPDDKLREIDGIGPAAVRNIRKALAKPQ